MYDTDWTNATEYFFYRTHNANMYIDIFRTRFDQKDIKLKGNM